MINLQFALGYHRCPSRGPEVLKKKENFQLSILHTKLESYRNFIFAFYTLWPVIYTHQIIALAECPPSSFFTTSIFYPIFCMYFFTFLRITASKIVSELPKWFLIESANFPLHFMYPLGYTDRLHGLPPSSDKSEISIFFHAPQINILSILLFRSIVLIVLNIPWKFQPNQTSYTASTKERRIILWFSFSPVVQQLVMY